MRGGCCMLRQPPVTWLYREHSSLKVADCNIRICNTLSCTQPESHRLVPCIVGPIRSLKSNNGASRYPATLPQHQTIYDYTTTVMGVFFVLFISVIKNCLAFHRKISINAVRMARSPLADTVLPPPQRFLFVQTRSNVRASLVGGNVQYNFAFVSASTE